MFPGLLLRETKSRLERKCFSFTSENPNSESALKALLPKDAELKKKI
jgi:hypothetical protein